MIGCIEIFFWIKQIQTYPISSIMQKKPNPHHVDIQPNTSLINLSFAQQNKANMTLDQIVSRTNRKLRLISILVTAIYKKRLTNAFNYIKYKPLRTHKIKKRLVQVFLTFVRRSEYNQKYQTFSLIKKIFINQKNQQVKEISTILSKAKLFAFKLISILLKRKEKDNIQMAFKRFQLYAKRRYQTKCDNHRKAFRSWIKVYNTVLRKHFLKLKSSRYLIQKRLKVNSIAKVLKQYRQRSLKSGMQRLCRNMLRQRQQAIRQQILQTQKKLEDNQDTELKSLKSRKQQLEKSIADIKKQKQQISLAYQTQVKQAQSLNIEIQQKTKKLKQDNQKLLKQINQINHKLNQPYTLDEVYQIFYNNLLYYIAKNRNSSLSKTQMLQALTKPLVPIHVPLDKMKEQNKVLKELIHEYELIYGPKSLQGKEIQIPYQYLVKENQTMYKMLITLLPNLQYHKKDIMEMRESLESVENIVKEFKA